MTSIVIYIDIALDLPPWAIKVNAIEKIVELFFEGKESRQMLDIVWMGIA
jgi:hypothetical protein